jgi:hypothetical protein
MDVELLTPLGGLVLLAVIAPLVVLRSRERHIGRLRSVLNLPDPSPRSRTFVVGALVGTCALLALAAAQPVISTARTVEERTDAQVFVVLDTSRSMLAASGPDQPTRLDRAEEIAKQVAAELPEIPVGLASMTDRLLPHAFPTTNRRVVDETLDKTLSIESPGPSSYFSTRATALDTLADAPELNYFPGSAKKRVLVVLTDGETRPVTEDLAGAFAKKPKIEVLFVHLWDENERVYLAGVTEIGYSPDATSETELAAVAEAVDGEVLGEAQAGELSGRIRELVGDGPTATREHEGERRALMPWITLLALLPLAYVLRRRNL